MTAYNSSGTVITPSSTNPFNVSVYGEPSGVISPVTQTVSTGSATFTYTGVSFPNNILIDAWIGDVITGGYAIGQTLLLPQNPTCTAGTQNYSVPLTSTVPNALQIHAAVGYLAAPAAVATYTVDTGSIGTVVPQSELPSPGITASTFVIGPGPAGTTCYDSDNQAYYGNYYLAPVDIKASDGSIVQTDPIMVLAVDECCNVTDCASLTVTSCNCEPALHYIGVGFDREGPAPGDLFQSPAQNAFLHVTDDNNGTDINQGYILPSPNGVAGDALTLGINSTGGYTTSNLTADTEHPGDFELLSGCFSFPDLPSPNTFCGKSILDVGIKDMLLKLPCSQWPSGTYSSSSYSCTPNPPIAGQQVSISSKVKIGVAMGVASSTPSPTPSPLVSYSFTTGDTPSGPDPSTAIWQDTTGTALATTPIVNTGRNPLNCDNYLYAGQCGVVGFEKISPPPVGCP